MSEILDLSTAKESLAETSSARDTHIQNTIDNAERVLLDYIGGFADLTEFYYEFGEQGTQILEAALIVMVNVMVDTPTEDPINAAVKSLVRRYRQTVIT